MSHRVFICHVKNIKYTFTSKEDILITRTKKTKMNKTCYKKEHRKETNYTCLFSVSGIAECFV